MKKRICLHVPVKRCSFRYDVPYELMVVLTFSLFVRPVRLTEEDPRHSHRSKQGQDHLCDVTHSIHFIPECQIVV